MVRIREIEEHQESTKAHAAGKGYAELTARRNTVRLCYITLPLQFGLDDLFGLVVRPNKRQITRSIYEAKVARWRSILAGANDPAWDETITPPVVREPLPELAVQRLWVCPDNTAWAQ